MYLSIALAVCESFIQYMCLTGEKAGGKGLKQFTLL